MSSSPNPLPAASVPSASEATQAAHALRSTEAIRSRACQLLARARAGGSAAFAVDDAALAGAARTVAELTRSRFPDLRIPYHSRWRHFEAGGVDRRAQLDAALQARHGRVTAAQRARAQIDLALVSVLLDAGAGPGWRYLEPGPGGPAGSGAMQAFSRSEGLGVASFQAFVGGLFSSDPADPLRADANGLRALRAQQLAAAFQVAPDNPLVGLEGRTALLNRLGDALLAHPATYAARDAAFDGPPRPGGLYDALLARAGQQGVPGTLAAHDLLVLLLETLSPIWPSAQAIGGVPLGDCWPHPAVQGPGLTAGWMPLHKLSQWLSYSLLEPFEWAGVQVQGLDALTGLPEYRNGGLLIDSGVLRPLPADAATRRWPPGDPFIVEWRALTVALLDELAPRVRAELGLSAEAMPLACVLEGGTWAAGRLLAQRLRGGAPPIEIDSDGTVF